MESSKECEHGITNGFTHDRTFKELLVNACGTDYATNMHVDEGGSGSFSDMDDDHDGACKTSETELVTSCRKRVENSYLDYKERCIKIRGRCQ